MLINTVTVNQHQNMNPTYNNSKPVSIDGLDFGPESKYAPVIINEIQRYRLLNLSKVPPPAGLPPPRSKRGPFVVLQRGAMPGDMKCKPLDFILTREELWLPLFAFFRLPEQERHDLCVFQTAVEVIQHLQNLNGPAIVDAERSARALRIDLPAAEDLIVEGELPPPLR